MKVAFIFRSNNHPATRYRVLQYFEHLQSHDIEIHVEIFPHSILGWWLLVKRIKDARIVFIQKKRVPNFWLSRIRRNGSKIIYDVDDAVMFASSRHKSPSSPRRMREFINMVRTSDAIIAGNSYLKSLAEPYNPHVHILPTSIDLSRYKIKDYNQPTDKITLGWIGGGKSLVFLKNLLPRLEDLAKQFPQLQLKIVCNEFFSSKILPIIEKNWSESDETTDILTFDIGLAPLPDDPWSRGKCAAKLLQYMAAGVPTVASPVGVHCEIIKQGINGYLAAQAEDWTKHLTQLIENQQLRKTMGQAARKTVEEEYSLAVAAPKLISLFKQYSYA